MSLYVLSAFLSLFRNVAFIIKGNANNGRNASYYPFPALMIPFPDKAFINEKPQAVSMEKLSLKQP